MIRKRWKRRRENGFGRNYGGEVGKGEGREDRVKGQDEERDKERKTEDEEEGSGW